MKNATVIVRKTTGWQKEIDYISVSQFKNLTGIKTDVTVADALKRLWNHLILPPSTGTVR
ncbi:hypothetical protein EGH17_03300 [Neisseria gonorrhoeae]|uniref:hypothetical protein n=1 Tax=Neisseria gonorrhoeae TaxID=485 RepID=UPI000F5BD5BD|nr:hypothetical protein [Neisseria gonorrhoeae]AZG31688.1 hypothetical protein EGH17_03300 [Neisseria gonorrhoeae]